MAYLALPFKLNGVKRVSGTNDIDRSLPRVGAAIRHARRACGLSQEALADHSGLDRSHLGRIERGERNLTILNLQRIAGALDMKAWQLLEMADV